MSDVGVFPYTLKSDLMIELPVPRRIKDSLERSKLTFRDLTILFDDISLSEDMKKQRFDLATSQQDITGSELSGMNKADWENILERLKTSKNDKDKLTQDDMIALRIEMELRRAFQEQKRNAFNVTTPSVVKSVDRDRRSRPITFAFGCKHISDVRKFLQPFELLIFLTEFCEEMLGLLAENKTHTHHELMKDLELLKRETDNFKAAGERISAREQARQCYYEINLSIAKSRHTPLANNILRGIRNCADQLTNLGIFQKKDTSANFSEFLKLIGNESNKPSERQNHVSTGGAYNSTPTMSIKLREVIRIVRLLYRLNHWSAFHVSKDITRSLTTNELESIRFQSQRFKVIYTPVPSFQDNNATIDFRVPEVLTTPDIIALVRQFDSKFCKVLSGKESDMNAYQSTYRDTKGNYRMFRTAPAALTINRMESLSSELLSTAAKRFKVGIALYDSWSRVMEMKSVSNQVLHPKTTGTEGEFLTPAKVVSLFYTEYSMMSKADFDEDDSLINRARLAISHDRGDEPVNLTKGINPKQQEAFMAAIQQYSDCLLRYDLDTSQKTIDEFNSIRQLTENDRRTKPLERPHSTKYRQDLFDVLNTPLDFGVRGTSDRNITGDLRDSENSPHVHLLFVPVLGSILTFIQKRDEYDLFTEPICSNSFVLTQNTCLALVAVDACDHTVYVYDPATPENAVTSHERLLAIFMALLSMSFKFRKPYAISTTYSSASALSSSFYALPEAKSKKAWFEQLLQLAETMIRDYKKTSPPMLYHNSTKFMANLEGYNVEYKVTKRKIEKGKIIPSQPESKQLAVTVPVISAAMSCRYAEFLIAHWVPPTTTRIDTRMRSSLSPDAFIKHEDELAGAGSHDAYIEKVIKRVFGSVFRVPTPYTPTQFGKKGNNKSNKGRGQGRGRGRGNRGRGRGGP